MAATAAVQFKRVPLAPTQTIPNGFNQRTTTKQLAAAAAANLARKRREAAQTEPSDLCFNLQQHHQTRRSQTADQQQASGTRDAPANAVSTVKGPTQSPGQKYKASCATLAGGCEQAALNRNTVARSAPVRVSASAAATTLPTLTATSQQQQVQQCRFPITTATTAAGQPVGGPQTQVRHGRSSNNLRHWKSSATPLNCVHLTPLKSRRRLVVSSTKSLLQLNTLSAHPGAPSQLVVGAPTRGDLNQASEQRQQLRPALKSNLDAASGASRLFRSHLNHHPIRQIRKRSPSATKTAPTAKQAPPAQAPSAAARVALLAPKRALSCNQLAQKLEQAPKVAKTAPGSAITNSRLRQGALFARRQCQLASRLSVADSALGSSRDVTETTPTSATVRPPHLTRRDTRNQQQQEVYKSTRLAQAHRRTAIVASSTQKVATTLTKNSTTATKTISISKPALVPSKASCNKRDLSTSQPNIGRRRWSSLESSNNDDEDEESSPSSSSSTLSTESSCLIHRPLDYLPTATGATSLIGVRGEQEARGSGSQWRGRRSSSPSLEDHKLQPQKRKANERCTRQPAGAEQQKQQNVKTDEISDDSRHQQCRIDAKQNSASDNPSAQHSDCSSCKTSKIISSLAESGGRNSDVSEIVVKQPANASFITRAGNKSNHDEEQLATCNDDTDLNESLSLEGQHHSPIKDNCQELSDKSMVRVEHQNQPTVVGLEFFPNIQGVCRDELTTYSIATTARISNAIDADTDSPKSGHSSAQPESFVSLPDKMMISAGQSDNNETSLRKADDHVNNNRDQEVRLAEKNHHQPLGLLQTSNIDQRQQQKQQPKESPPSTKPNELTKSIVKPASQQPNKTEIIPIKEEPICDHYDLEARPFARGKFAQVKRCVKKDTKECFAAKCIKKRRRLVDIRHEILLEIEALKLSYRTDYIVKLYEVYETPNEMILILEMANGGELQRVLDDEESISESQVRKMVGQILEGLVHLHDDQIVHLDIKPQNLLLTKPFPDGDVKLCDFGISRRISECEIRDICGTPDYTAPEVLQYDPISLNTDMWSLGVVTYVLLSGYSPFGSENKQQTFCNITTCLLDFPSELFDGISENAIDFVRKLIVLQPSMRLTSRQALSHPWLSQ